jgi:hypothetical protein
MEFKKRKHLKTSEIRNLILKYFAFRQWMPVHECMFVLSFTFVWSVIKTWVQSLCLSAQNSFPLFKQETHVDFTLFSSNIRKAVTNCWPLGACSKIMPSNSFSGLFLVSYALYSIIFHILTMYITCCSCRCSEAMSLKCGQQRAYYSFSRWYMRVESHYRIILTRKTEGIGEKPIPVPLCPPQIQWQTRAWTRASAVEAID